MASEGAEKVPLPPQPNDETLSEHQATAGDVRSEEADIRRKEVPSSDSSSLSTETDEPVRPRFMTIQCSYRSVNPDRSISQTYGPITDLERNELRNIASLHRSRTQPTAATDDLERKDTLAGISDDDPRFDPESPHFDIYFWARREIRAMDEEDIKWARAGFAFKDLNVSGSGSALSFQSTVASVMMAPLRLKETFNFGHKVPKRILRNFEGVVRSGEMLIVLGRPGSGCTTFLKTMCGELAGLELDQQSTIHYNGITQQQMLKEFKGELVYNQETDKHFPHLTVGETLSFAAASRTPQKRARGMTRKELTDMMTKVVMAVFGLSHTRNTKVGDDFVRGVSGGERKVS